ncbi:MAG TPA: UDP-N-acetylmuramate dehydrogenase [Actinomycetota bacterium]
MDDVLGRAEAILRPAMGPRVHTSFAMAPLTTFRIGGPAAIFVEPESEDDLSAVSAAVRETAVPLVVIGKGSNVLVSDRGFPGIVLRLGRAYRWAARDGDALSAGGAMPLPALAGVALRHGLSGMEFGVAIPATLGGAVKMNAGAHTRSMSEVLTGVDVFLLGEGATRTIAATDAGFAYRRSALPSGGIVIGASVELTPGGDQEIRERMDQAREWRRRTQPLAEPNCGSVFKNPPDGYAARLIEEAGLKGLRVGGVQVSTKHANFIVADPGADADDVRTLIARIQAEVQDRYGVELEPEVQMIGGFADVAR